MAIKERDVVLMGKDGADGTIDLPVTRLGNIEDGAEVKTTLADADALPVVDSADAQEMKKITWANLIAAIKGKLDRVYAAVSHEHTKSEITDFPTSMTPTAHKDSHKTGGSDALTAADVGARPSTWTPSKADVGLGNVPNVATNDQTPTFTQATSRANLVSGEKLSVLFGKLMKWFADLKAVAFSGSATDLSTGTLNSARLPTVPLNKGGTNATTAAAARTNLGALGAFSPVNITISATWSGSGPWTQNVAVSGVKAAWNWRLGLHLAKITDDASRKLQEKAMMCIVWCETYDGGITLTCRDKKPDVAIQAVLSGEV